MIDPIGTTASTLDIAEKIGAGIRWLWRHVRGASAEDSAAEPSWDFELRPIGFAADLTQQIPMIEISFYAINYLRRPVNLTDAKVTRLSLGSGVAIDGIALFAMHEGITLAPRRSCAIMCRRPLSDAEARALGAYSGVCSAAFSLTAHAARRRREYRYGPVAAMAIDGWVRRT